jgi:Phage capsid protein
MSQEIGTAHVAEYTRGVEMVAQQMSERIRAAVRTETQHSKKQAFDQVGVVAARKRSSRHQDTIRVDVPHKRRWVTLEDWEISDLVDHQDTVRTLNDPTNTYVQTFGAALSRAIDTTILSAALGTAATDETGATSVPFLAGNIVAAGGTSFTLAKLLEASRLLKKGTGVDTRLMDLHVAWTSFQEKDFINAAEVKSIDYNTQKVLVAGGVDSFLAFTFHRMEDWTDELGNLNRIVPWAAATRSCVAWVKDGLLFSSGEEIRGRIDPRVDKGYSMQVYAAQSIGATRMQEAKVVQIDCAEA